MLEMAVIASDAFVEWKDGSRDSFVVRGRPVERAIVLAGLEEGISQDEVLTRFRRVDFLSFQSDRQYAVSLHELPDTSLYQSVVVGAPELIMSKSSFVLDKGEVRPLDAQKREKLSLYQSKESGKGARMVAVAYKEDTESTFSGKFKKGRDNLDNDFIFGGFIVLTDPIRKSARKSIKVARESGIRVIMLTGDYPQTAGNVASAVGIRKSDDPIRLGSEVEELSDQELLRDLRSVNVFARMLPHQKLRIARLLKADGEVVAMTGDGVNDALALRSADIGIALGSGTDVAKEASDLVLLNNSFDVIVYAIEEGRRVVDNLKKIVAYLLSTGFSEITVVGGALLFGAPLPLLPAQILWINIIEEGFMNFSFAFEPKEKGLMKRNPRATGGTILTPNLKKLIFIIAVITGVFLLTLYFVLLRFNFSIEEIRTIMFIALSVDSIFFSLSIKNLHKPLWKIDLFSNKYLLFAMTISMLVLFIALAFPPLQTLLSLTPFSSNTVFLVFGLGVVNLFIIEIVKYFVFKRLDN